MGADARGIIIGETCWVSVQDSLMLVPPAADRLRMMRLNCCVFLFGLDVLLTNQHSGISIHVSKECRIQDPGFRNQNRWLLG